MLDHVSTNVRFYLHNTDPSTGVVIYSLNQNTHDRVQDVDITTYINKSMAVQENLLIVVCKLSIRIFHILNLVQCMRLIKSGELPHPQTTHHFGMSFSVLIL